MESPIVEKHKKLLSEFIGKLHENQYAEFLSLEKHLFTMDLIESWHQELLSKKKETSFLRAIRSYLQDKLHLPYDEALRVIINILGPEFLRLKLPYYRAIQNYNRDRKIDQLNATAEWRAYFEFRFSSALSSHFDRYFEEYWLTVNFNLYSFINKNNLPLYRYHSNVPEKDDLKVASADSPYIRRERAFEQLRHFQRKYSTVWESTKNDLTSIFYFDKTVESKMDMVVYEIDPDVLPSVGQVKPKYVSRFRADGTHRAETILEINENDAKPEDAFNRERRIGAKNGIIDYGAKERAFQYSIIRFLIRSGIFDPRYAAYYTKNFEHRFDRLLKRSYDRFKESTKENRSFDNAYDQALFEQLSGIESLGELEKIVDQQFRSSKKRKPEQDYSGNWINYDHNEKYSKVENEALDKVIALFDLFDSEVLDVRLSIFEAGFFYLTQQDNNTIAHIYWIPIIINWKDRWVGGTIFINSDKRIGDRPKEAWVKDSTTNKYKDGSTETSNPLNPEDIVPQDLIGLMYYLNGLFADKQIGEIEETLRPAQERSAAVSIMSRNISHNIGSHVLSYLKNLLSNENEMIRENVLGNVIHYDAGEFSIKQDKSAIMLPYLRSIGRLFGYFQERQDYIGTFASDRYLFFSPIYLYKGVLDFFYGKIPFKAIDNDSKGSETRNLILDYIVYSEGYRQADIQIKTYFQKASGEKIEFGNNQPDFEIALPAGNTGRQGIYTILENFIRNSAKHGEPHTTRKKLEINILISEPKDKQHAKDYYRVDIQDNSGAIPAIKLANMKDVLKTPLVIESGVPDERHKGIKEIQIAAGWIRGILPHELKDVDILKDQPAILKLDNYTIAGAENPTGLQYTFYLRRPKVGILIVKDSSRYFHQDTQELKEEFKASLTNWDIVVYREGFLLLNGNCSYQFVVVNEEVKDGDVGKNKKLMRDIISKSPVRIIWWWNDAQLGLPNLKLRLYEAWLNKASPTESAFSQFSLVLSDKNINVAGNPEQPGEKDIKIYIHDGKPIDIPDQGGIDTRNINSFVIKGLTKEAPGEHLLFGRHYDADPQFDALMGVTGIEDDENTNAAYNQYAFIEGISGGNTTERLLRNETIDHYWRYKIIEAALTKIIIIDERKWKDYYEPATKLSTYPSPVSRNFERWRKKNVHIFSLEYAEQNPDYLWLIDIKGDVVATMDKEGNFDFTSEEYRALYAESHFISLHQGLLERAMKHCEGVLHGTEQDQVDDFLKRLYRMQAQFRLIIHSGRSKAHILPKQAAFIQLSALESALKDCKHTLCELFYSTIQE